MPPKIKDAIEIQDAIMNLESIINIDLEAPGPIGILKKTRIITNEAEFPEGHIEWLDAEGSEVLLEVLDESFRSVHQYLKYLAQSKEIDWENERGLRVIGSTVALAAEAAHKMEKYLELRLGRPKAKISERSEFLEMKNYYHQFFSNSVDVPAKLLKHSQEAKNRAAENELIDAFAEKNWDKEQARFEIKVESELPPRESRKVTTRPEFKAMHDYYVQQFAAQVAEQEPQEASDLALKDMQEIRLDKDYELFYIRREDGMPFYEVEVLRNMRLICDFEGDVGFEEDPLLKIRAIQDRDAAAAAGQILGDCDFLIADFYKVAKKIPKDDLVAALSRVCLSLFLAHNPRNLLQNGTGKTSLQYFEDFHHFLREAFQSSEYQKLLAYPPEKEDTQALTLLQLVHGISKSFFRRSSGVKTEVVAMIHRTARKGASFEKKATKEIQAHSVWSEFLLEDEAYRTLLAKFPSGPLLKVLDFIRDEEEESVPFDSIEQGNYPMQLFEASSGEQRIEFLHLPSPTKQSLINRADVLDEFRGMLRAYGSSKKGEKHLMIGLQDRTSWKDLARCTAIEGLQKNAEFNRVFFVATVPKHSQFYFQSGKYLHKDNAKEFMELMRQQYHSLEEAGIETGFSLSSTFKAADLSQFAEAIIPFIHQYFFNQQKSLSRLEREEFIEIFDLFYYLKLIDHHQPTSVSFTCKDAIDTGATQTAAFYAFLKLLNDDFTTKEAKDRFRSLLYAPALLVRERAVNQECLNRTLSALQRVETSLLEQSKKIRAGMDSFYHPQWIKNLTIST